MPRRLPVAIACFHACCLSLGCGLSGCAGSREEFRQGGDLPLAMQERFVSGISVRGASVQDVLPYFWFSGAASEWPYNVVLGSCEPGGVPRRGIDVRVESVSAADMLKLVCEKANLSVRVPGRTVVLAPRYFDGSVSAGTNSSPLVAQLDAITIPEIKFDQAPLGVVAAVLSNEVSAVTSGQTVIACTLEGYPQGSGPLAITMSGRCLTVMEVLRVLTLIAPVDCHLEEKTVIFRLRTSGR